MKRALHFPLSGRFSSALFFVAITFLIPLTLPASQVIESEDTASCRSALDAFLIAKIGEDEWKTKKDAELSLFYSKCDEWMSPVLQDGTSDGDGLAGKDVSATFDPSRVMAKLVEMGSVANKEIDVVVMASELIGKNLTETFFTAGSKKGPMHNECEGALSESLAARGFLPKFPSGDPDQFIRMRSFGAVVGRYKDPSAMPNFTAARAASIVSADINSVVVCQAKADAEPQKGKEGFEVCAKARCKAVDMKSLRRISGVTESLCFENQDKTTATIGAIKAVCGKVGHSMGAEMVSYFSDGEGK